MKNNILLLATLFTLNSGLAQVNPQQSIKAQTINELITELNQVTVDLTKLNSLEEGEPIKTEFYDRTDNIALTAIPKDDTPPQITEGTQIFDITYTPTKIGNELIIESLVTGGETTNIDDAFVSSIFINNQANAIITGQDGLYTHGGTNLQSGSVRLIKKITISSLSPISIMVRAGIANGILNRVWYYDASGRPNFANTTSSWIKVTELHKN